MKTITGKFLFSYFLVSVFSLVNISTAFAGQITYTDKNYQAGDAVNATDFNDTFNEIKAKVNDNDTRTSILEGKSPAVGRIVVPIEFVSGTGVLNSTSTTLPDAVSTTATGAPFPTPADYVSGGTVTVKAIISGCGGSTIAYQTSHPALTRVSIGLNTSILTLLCNSGTCPTVNIPSAGTLQFSAVAVESTFTSLGDLNYPYFTRHGADANDACTTDLFIRGFIIEYPRG